MTHSVFQPSGGAAQTGYDGTTTLSWVIRRKITAPPLGESVVPRPRVESLLTGLVDQHRVTFVYASAGAGKTTAILQAVERLRRPLVWLDLDSTDVATGRLLIYLEAALGTQIPEIAGVASAVLAARLPHPEVAGLLAESVGERPVVVVLDNAERLGTSPEALDVVASFARYLPSTARLVLASRSELGFSSALGASPWVAAIGEEDLALTVEEAQRALEASGRGDIDPVDAVVETGGWMTGVLFEAWRASDHVIGLGGEADPLHGYLATEILGQLNDADVDFLVRTSLLEEVTVPAAEALGLEDAAARLHSLAGRRLPAAWPRSGSVMRCHPRFREFLQRRLGRLPDTVQRDLRAAHARLLLAENHDEEAVEEYLAGGCLADALAVMSPPLERVIERTDFALAEAWLAAVAPVRTDHDLSLAAAELMLAVVRERFSAGVALGDRLEQRGRRAELAATSGRAAGLMAWCYLHAGRVADIEAVLSVAAPGPDVEAARYAMTVVRDEPGRQPVVELSGGPLDALVLRTHYDLGRLSLLHDAPSSLWAAKATESWRVSALLTSGSVERAFELYHRLAAAPDRSVWLTGLLGPRLMFEISDVDEAWRLLREGRREIQATGSALFESYSLVIEADLELRSNGDPQAARAVLDRLAEHPVGGRYVLLKEHAQMLGGRALLMQGEDEAAAELLRRAVTGMRRGQRLLYLATAAVYLSEAEWRCGNETAADRAAELAATVAGFQGSNHYLLSALSEFPDVVARRIDLEPTGESIWHDFGRTLLLHSTELPVVLGSAVALTEFGRLAVSADGREVNPGLSKSLELLALLANSDRREMTRDALLDALFDGKRDASTSAYLRQAVLRLRKALPDVLDADAPAGTVRLGPVRASTESRRLIGLLAEAAAQRDERRLELLQAALDLADRGTYLPAVASAWADERRQRIDELVRSARLEAGEVALSLGRYGLAAQLADQVVKADPYRESGWRLIMRVAALMGDQDRVLTTYRSCEQALAEVGGAPSESTAALVRDLRR